MIQGRGVFSAFRTNFFCSAVSLLWLLKQRHHFHPSWVCNLSGGVYFEGSVKNTKGGSEATRGVSETRGCCNGEHGREGVIFFLLHHTDTKTRLTVFIIVWADTLSTLISLEEKVHGQPIRVMEPVSVKLYDNNMTHWIAELCDTKIRRYLVRDPAVRDGTQQHGCNYHFNGGVFSSAVTKRSSYIVAAPTIMLLTADLSAQREKLGTETRSRSRAASCATFQLVFHLMIQMLHQLWGSVRLREFVQPLRIFRGNPPLTHQPHGGLNPNAAHLWSLRASWSTWARQPSQMFWPEIRLEFF